jgi:YfiH family protein
MLSPLEAENLKSLPGIRHGFFTRQGGVSEGIYASLNCGFGSSDDSGLVAVNRNRVASHLGGIYEGVVTLYQEHGTTAIEVCGPVNRSSLPHADAVVSATPGLVIGVLAADCAPVLFADPEARVVAAAHAGWRGAVAGIIDSAISEMERLGARRERIRAAVGPCINQDAYEVGAEFEAQLLARDPATSRFFARRDEGSQPHFDLPGFVLQRLRDAGIGDVAGLSPCTHQNESLFFSYRRKTQRHEPDYGRQISAIVVA